MLKRDIAIEMKRSIEELRHWAEKLYSASPALSRDLSDRASSIESVMASRGMDSDRALITIGKVEGLVTAASVLHREWTSHQ